MTNPNTGRPTNRSFFASADAITDNHSFFEWAENSRKILHAAALDLGVTASELEAKLRRIGNGVVLVPGVTARARAKQVAGPIQRASESLVVASQYIITATNRFHAAYLPELETAGYKPRRDDFTFKA